jgi:thymidine kinase
MQEKEIQDLKCYASKAKLRFFHSVMNSGKSTLLLQSDYNYRSEGNNTLILTSKKDDRFGTGFITSRLNVYIKQPCIPVAQNENVLEIFKKELKKKGSIACVFIDEAQFFTKKQIEQMTDIVDFYNTPVDCFGLKNNYLGGVFEGSMALFESADECLFIPRKCHCANDANMILRYDPLGNIQRSGQEVVIGSEDQYQSVCRLHWKKGDLGPKIYEKLGIQDPFIRY